jgi:hypothetical protein
MSRTFRTVCLDFRYCLVYYFTYLLCIACFRYLPLDAANFENLQELQDMDFEQQLARNPSK